MNDFGCVFIIQWLIEMHIFVSNIVSPSSLSLSNSPRSIAIQRDIVPIHSRTRTLVAGSSGVGAFAVAVVRDQPGFDVEITSGQRQATHIRGNRPRDGIAVQVPAFNKKRDRSVDVPHPNDVQRGTRSSCSHFKKNMKPLGTTG